MADAAYIQTSFLGGERSKTSQGRIDLPDYRTGMNVCLNGIPVEQGAWTRRPGFAHGAMSRGGAPSRVITFAFQQDTPYTMSFTDGWLRFFADHSLVMTNDAQAVVSISSASPAFVTTTTAHGWATGNQGMFNTLGTPDGLLENRQFAFTVTGASTLTLTDAATGANIDGSTLAAFTTGNITRILEIATPYVTGTWSAIRPVQAEQSITLLHAAYAPQVLSVTKLPVVTTGITTFAEFSLVQGVFTDGPYLDPATHGTQVTPSAKTGVISLTLSFPAYVATKAYTIGDYVTDSSVSYQSLVDQNVGNTPASRATKWKVVAPYVAISPTGFTSADIGRHIRLCSEPPLWVVGTTYGQGNVVSYAGVYWTSLAGSNTGNIPGLDITKWGINPTAANWTWGKIVTLQSQISNSLSGSVNIGNMTSGGGLTAAMDNNTVKSSGACALFQTSGVISSNGQTLFCDGYVGKNYSGASAQQILFGTFYPSIDVGAVVRTEFSSVRFDLYTRIRLRAKQTAPSAPDDGTLLGEYEDYVHASTVPTVTSVPNPVVINSNDQTTAWNYVWFEILARCQAFDAPDVGITLTISTVCAQVQFFGTNASSSNGVSVEILGPDLLYTTPIRLWRLGLYTGTNWPSCGTYHEGRLFLSGSVPNRFDASVSNDLFNFKPTEVDGTVADNDAIDYTMNAPDVNSIMWMQPNQQGVVIGTEKGEWLVQASALNNPLTPTNTQAHQVTRIGSSVVSTAEPIMADHTTLFIQRYQRNLMEYFPDIFSGKFSAPNIALNAGHLTSRRMVELAYQQSISPVVWARCADGSLIGCSYKRETLMSSQGPAFAGWHPHTHGGTRTFQSIATGPSEDGTLDTLAAVTLGPDGMFQIEFLTTLFQETDALTSARFLDESLVPTVAQNIVFGGQSTMQCTGLWHLNGKSPRVFAGGLDCGSWPVTNGKLNVPYGKDPAGLFTAAFINTFTGTIPVVIGFTYNSDGQLVRPATPQESGARTGPAIGKTRRTQYLIGLLLNVRGISFGTDFSNLKPAQLTTPGGTPIADTEMFSGTIRHPLIDGYSYDSMLAWRVSGPYPATICSLGGMLQTQDS